MRRSRPRQDSVIARGIASPDTAGRTARSTAFRPAGANAERTRVHNRRLVLGHVRDSQGCGRADIARGAGLSIQAVSNIIAELHADGLLLETGRRVLGRGQPAMQYVLNPSGGHAIGVELRSDALSFVVIDLAGTTCYSAREPVDGEDPDAVATILSQLRSRASEAPGLDCATWLGAGVVMPGPFTETGLSGAPSDLAGWRSIDAARWFQDALGLETLIENDANAAALGERVSGGTGSLDSYAFVYFGAGLGLGIVHEGRLMRGSLGNAGELGHVRVPLDGEAIALEDVASRIALVRRLDSAGLAAGTVEAIDAVHQARQPAVLDWIQAARPALAQAVQLVENLLDPQTIVFGGALPDALLDELIESLPLTDRSVACRSHRALPRVIRGGAGRLSAAIGGAALVVNRTFTPQLAALH